MAPPNLFIYATGETMSKKSRMCAFATPIANVFTARDNARSSKQFMCCSFSRGDHRPPVLTYWQWAPQPLVGASVSMVNCTGVCIMALPFQHSSRLSTIESLIWADNPDVLQPRRIGNASVPNVLQTESCGL